MTDDTFEPGGRLKALGIELPTPGDVVGAYDRWARVGRLLFVSGRISRGESGAILSGRVGDEVDVEEAARRARLAGSAIVEVDDTHDREHAV